MADAPQLVINETFSALDCKGYPIDIKIIQKHLCFSNGFFIEVGANDGVTYSNTFLLERHLGWRGLLIEPSPIGIQKCRAVRSPNNFYEQCALVSDSGATPFVEGDFDGHLMSSIHGARLGRGTMAPARARTLNEICAQHGIANIGIDFMSLDIEGRELDALRGLDLAAAWAPRFFLIEVYPAETEALNALLFSHGYELLEAVTGYNLVDNPGWDGNHNDFLYSRR